MKVEHVAIDGSVVTLEAQADLSAPATATGWAIVPSMMRAHPFTSTPAGQSQRLEEMVRKTFPNINLGDQEQYAMREGQIRTIVVRLATATEGTRQLTVGAWEGQHGSLVTSLIGSERKRLLEMFDSLKFRQQSNGIAITSRVVGRPRTPEVTKEVPGLGVLGIRPATASELERVPRAKGFVTDGGELFRLRQRSQAMLFVSDSALVSITPLNAPETGDPAQSSLAEEQATQAMVAIASQLKVEWQTGGAR